jgi:hypothetical protein
MITKHFRILVTLILLAAVASVSVSAGPVIGTRGLEQNKKPGLPKYQKPPASPNVSTIPAPTYLSVVFNVIIGSGPNRTAKLVVGNYTDTTIPKGTTIYWSIIGQDLSNSPRSVGGSFPLGGDLRPRDSTISPVVSLSPLVEIKEKKAWYYK